jgi:hypothetical protein
MLLLRTEDFDELLDRSARRALADVDLDGDDADQALWAGVLNFWFIGRVFDRVRQ